MNQNIVFKLLSFLFLVGCSFPFVSPTNLCSTSGLCCKHRDSECVAQRVYPNHTVDTSQLPCYCDHACIELGDCCPDYRQFCGVKDCHVSEWGPWSPCSAETCEEFGVEERHRVVLGHPINGGLKCPHLLQSKQCQALPCERQPEGSNKMESWKQHRQQKQQQKTFNNKGDENVLQSQQEKQQKQSNRRGGEDQELNKQPSTKHYNNQQHFNKKNEHARGTWKGPTLYKDKLSSERQLEVDEDDDDKDDALSSSHKNKVLAVKKRKNKRRKSDVDKSVATDGGYEGCMEMVIIRASSGCHVHDKRLHLGTRICVECSTNHRQLSSHNRYKNTDSYHNKNADKSSCSAALTEMPIRKFRINHTYHGKLTFLTKNMSTKCNCRKGLHYELV